MVLSLMEKRRGQKGFNALQGETLKLALEKVLTSLVSVFFKLILIIAYNY